ncbi:two-component sensor histidine kinase [Paractinoplanes deccanensis]|uniref:histidine kinase n=1 Tax=Paractinoplanes deccanensis TaxID=113561 RepID=A0ABQ3Y2C5_9ACTN|nr:histidine kinase [Actinoplanes deccanensis]GID74149.1 two-component sensor histidine kinase [Actinoplanes deccanensis]
MRTRVEAWARRRQSTLWDLLIAVIIGWATVQIEQAQGERRYVVLTTIAVAAVFARRRWPFATLLVVTVATLVTIATRAPSGGLLLALGVVLYAVPFRPREYACAVSAAIFVTGLIADTSSWWNIQALAAFSWIFGGAGLGLGVRARRAYIAEVTERARQAEQTREEEARRRVMDERLRIARELHDVVAHHIAVISVQAGAAGHVLQKHPEQVWPVLGHIRDAADTVLREIQSVIGVLRDPDEVDSTEPTSGLDRLPDLLSGLRAAGFRVRDVSRGTPRALPAVTDLAAYRIVQEALTNAHRYGDGSAGLEISYDADAITIDVTNTIVGFRVATRSGSGFGLIGMRERAAAAHGTLTTGPDGDGRYRVRAVLPVAPPKGTTDDHPCAAR